MLPEGTGTILMDNTRAPNNILGASLDLRAGLFYLLGRQDTKQIHRR